jgi:hypothetical protein
MLQERACSVLSNLVCCSIAKKKAIESGGIEVVLVAINKLLGLYGNYGKKILNAGCTRVHCQHTDSCRL